MHTPIAPLLVAALLTTNSPAQVTDPPPNVPSVPSYTGTITKVRVEPSLASRAQLTPAVPLTEAPQDGRSSHNLVVPGKDPQTENDLLASRPHRLKNSIPSRSPSLVFDVNNSVDPPSDPALAVGPDHVFVVYNTGFIIYSPSGTALTGPMNPNNIFSSTGCCDLTASYDAAADRWVISLLLFNGAEIAVSQGPDPITSAWNVYSISQISDYQKLSVWSDGYYMTDNTGSNNKVWALQRSAMLAGNPSAGIQSFNLPGLVTSGFHSPQVLNVSNDDMPVAGGATIVYMQDDAWGGVSFDHLKVWTIDVDWTTPANSTVSAATQLATTPFISVFDGGSFSNLSQPGGGSEIDALQATIMNQAQFRSFAGHNSAVFTFVVDTDAGAGELAGIRWYELRQPADNAPWAIEQEGTYTAPNGKHAWNGSMIMDSFGNIGLGYTGMAGPATPNPTSERVSSFYTGRFAADPPGTMTVMEELISAGNGNVQGFRYGDYNKIDISPADDKTFWFINEHIKNGSGVDVVGVFKLASDFDDDIGVITLDAPTDGLLTATEQVTVTVFNFGLTDASGFNVAYQIDGGTVVSEPFPGILATGTSAQFTFSATGDFSTSGQTYQVTAYTDLATDQYDMNDTLIQDVVHLLGEDVGVTDITAPASGSGLSGTEQVTIDITNFGGNTMTSVPVAYQVNGGVQVQETYTGSITAGQTGSYTFATTADLSALGTYTIAAYSELVSDQDLTNDTTTTSVENSICAPIGDCGLDDGVTLLQLADQNIIPPCGTNGYDNDPSTVFNFMMIDNPFSGVLQCGYDGNTYAIWIDFNDNNQFEAAELIATGNAPNANVNVSFTVDFGNFPNATQGMHRMRVRGGDMVSGFGDVLVPCDELEYGRTNDYMANITGTVSVDEFGALGESLQILDLGDDQFMVNLTSTSSAKLVPLTVFDLQGNTLAYYTMHNNSGYSMTIDMSHVAAGVYMLQVGGEEVNVVKKIVVR